MNISEIFSPLVGMPESVSLEYKATLIPAKALAQIIAAFANTDGGHIIFGVRELPKGKLELGGLSDDFKVSSILSKADRMLQPPPPMSQGYFFKDGKQLYGIQVLKSAVPVLVEGKIYKRVDSQTVDSQPPTSVDRPTTYEQFRQLKEKLGSQVATATTPKKKFIEQYNNILKVFETTKEVLFPGDLSQKTPISEGKTLNRLLYSSCMDNFETYLSGLLHEIYLANPDTLKGGDATMRVADILKCDDIDEVIQKLAAKKASKLQKGSIKGFLKDNNEIKSLTALTDNEVSDIEKALQIRHLYSHKNGIVDDHFQESFGDSYELNSEHQLTLLEVIEKMNFMLSMVILIDVKAAIKYQLSTNEPL